MGDESPEWSTSGDPMCKIRALRLARYISQLPGDSHKTTVLRQFLSLLGIDRFDDDCIALDLQPKRRHRFLDDLDDAATGESTKRRPNVLGRGVDIVGLAEFMQHRDDAFCPFVGVCDHLEDPYLQVGNAHHSWTFFGFGPDE